MRLTWPCLTGYSGSNIDVNKRVEEQGNLVNQGPLECQSYEGILNWAQMDAERSISIPDVVYVRYAAQRLDAYFLPTISSNGVLGYEHLLNNTYLFLLSMIGTQPDTECGYRAQKAIVRAYK